MRLYDIDGLQLGRVVYENLTLLRRSVLGLGRGMRGRLERGGRGGRWRRESDVVILRRWGECADS